MNLTDLIPPGQWHKLAHQEGDINPKERCARLEQAYGQDILQCLLQHGFLTNDPQEEYSLIMSTITLVDVILERATRTTQ